MVLCFGFRVTKKLKISAYLLKQWNKNLSPLKSNTQKVHLRAISNLPRSVETFMCDTREWDFILSVVFYLCLLWGFSCLCAKDPRKSCITTSDSREKDCEKEGWESLRHVHHRKQSQRGGAAEMENELSGGKKNTAMERYETNKRTIRWVSVSWVTEWLRLEATLKIIQCQPPAWAGCQPAGHAAQGSIHPNLECLQGWGSTKGPQTAQVTRWLPGQTRLWFLIELASRLKLSLVISQLSFAYITN